MFLILANFNLFEFSAAILEKALLQNESGTAQFYSVSTFTGKNHFKLIHNDMKEVSARAYRTNYFQQLTLESWYTNLQQTPLNRW